MKMIFLTLIIVVMQLLLYPWLVAFEVPHVKKLMILMDKEAPILMWGDSVIDWVSDDDIDRRTIVEMLDDKLEGNISVELINHAAYNPLVYKSMAGYLSRSNFYPNIVIVEVNLMSFSPQRDKVPYYQFIHERLVLDNDYRLWFRILYKPLLIFNIINLRPISSDEYFHTPVYVGNKRIGFVQDFETSEFLQVTDYTMSRTIMFRYMTSIDKEHRQLIALRETAAILTQKNIKAVFYITPIDHEIGLRYLGDDYIIHVQNNIQEIRSAVHQYSPYFLDLSLVVPSEYFNYVAYPNGHLKDKGRYAVAQSIFEYIEPIVTE